MKLSENQVKKIRETTSDIIKLLTQEKAHTLPFVCTSLGLREGDENEAMGGKAIYIRIRLKELTSEEQLEVLRKIKDKYPDSNLAKVYDDILDGDNLNIITGFKNIEESIIKEIRAAKYLIWVAVAWFTNRKLAEELYKKKIEGLSIQIITDDNEKNKELKLENAFEVDRIKKSGFAKMHHKFCIIDLERVIDGSYNWTNNANYSDEGINIIENRAIAKEFADRFKTLKNQKL